MTHDLIAATFADLADLLEPLPAATWDAPSLCAGWRVREVVAHVTMPARLTAEQFGADIAAAHGDFQATSDGLALRDASLPIAEHLDNLRSPVLAAWEPPGGGAIGGLNHAVVHSLDITNAVGLPAAASADALRVILDSLTEGGAAARFGVDVAGVALGAPDIGWSWGEGEVVTADAAVLVSLVSHRTLPGGRSFGGGG